MILKSGPDHSNRSSEECHGHASPPTCPVIRATSGSNAAGGPPSIPKFGRYRADVWIRGQSGRASDLSWLRGELKPHYSDIGRPSVCPELMIRMLLVGYCYSIRSERHLCEEV
jgi:hypothetical protein